MPSLTSWFKFWNKELKYVPWSSCTCREQEVLGNKKADVGTTIVPLSNGLLKTQKADYLYFADTGDSLKLQNALQRRALAAELQTFVTTTPCSC